MPLDISYYAMLVNFELTDIVIPAVYILIVHKLKPPGHIYNPVLGHHC